MRDCTLCGRAGEIGTDHLSDLVVPEPRIEGSAEVSRLLPTHGGDVVSPPPWAESAASVGFSYPADYCWFIETYGGGAINDYLRVWCPTSWNPRGDARDGFQRMTAESRSIDSCGPEHNDPPYCDINWNGQLLTFAGDTPDGLLLQWGQDDAGNQYYWSRETGDPDAWPVMVHGRNSGKWYRHEGSFLTCLLAVMREEFPFPGQPLNPEEEWEHARTQPVWEFEGDWRGLAD